MDDQDLIISKVKLGGGKVDVTYNSWNPSIEAYEKRSYEGKEAPHPDLIGAFNDLAKQAMQEMDFPSVTKVDKWGSYRLKEVTIDGLQVTCVVVFQHLDEGQIESKLPKTNSVQADVIETALDEARMYVRDTKRSQGNLFENNAEAPEPEQQEAVPA